MDGLHPRWKHRGKRMASSLLALLLIWTMVVGGLAGPWLLPAPSQASSAAQQIESIAIGQKEQSDFSPDGFATYGELITYTLRFTVGEGLHSSIVISDTFSDPPGAFYLAVTPTTSIGPIPMNGGFDPTDVPITVIWTGRPAGRPIVRWALLESITPPAGASWIYEIRYRALVHIDSQTPSQNNRKARCTATVRWQGGGPITSAPLDVTLVQPLNFLVDKTQTPTTELAPGQTFDWNILLRTYTGSTQSPAYDIVVTDTLPATAIFVPPPTLPPTATYTISGSQVIFTLPYLNPSGQNTTLNLGMRVPITQNLAHGPLLNNLSVYRSSAPGAALGEREWVVPDTYTGLIRNIDLNKAATTKTYYNNSATQAVGGEYVTITVDVRIPKGLVVYDPIVRILLRDGLTLTKNLTGTTWPDTVVFDPASQDKAKPAGSYWTQYQWSIDSITNTNTSAVTKTFVLQAQARHRYFNPFNPDKGKEIAHGYALEIVPIVRWAPAPGGDVYEDALCDPNQPGLCRRNTGTPSVQFIRPDLREVAENNGSWFTTSGSFQGGGNIVFTLHLDNQNGRPTAYDAILREHLSPNLTYVSASPPPADVFYGTEGTTITWNVGAPVRDDNPILFNVTATLPPTMAVGVAVTATAHAQYTTFNGEWPEEGEYYDFPPAVKPYTARKVLQGGLAVQKYVNPTDNVKIGDAVDYTLVLTVNPHMILTLPTFDDPLPKGFHYVPDSFSVENGQLLTGSLQITGTGAPNYQNRMRWGLLTIDNLTSSNAKVVAIHYRALLKGLDYRYPGDGNPVYITAGDMRSRITVRNTVNVCWSGGLYCLPADPQGTRDAVTKIVQPYLADPPWNKVRTELTDEYEVGDDVNFKVTIKNTGQGPAYDIHLEDILPHGLAYKSTGWNLTPADPTFSLIYGPAVSATGTISWTLNHLNPQTTLELSYRTQVMPSALPGITLTNQVRIVDYTSLPDYPPYDRHYADFSAIPAPKSCKPFIILGVGLDKVDNPDPVAPGAVLTYTLYFSNTSSRYSAVNVRITDTYDANLTYLGATVSDPRIEFVGIVPPRNIVWRIYTMPNNDPTRYWIRPRFTVAQPFDPDDSPLRNQAGIDGVGDATGAVWRTEETTVKMPALVLRKTGTPPAVAPGGKIIYTLYFTNTAADMPATDVRIQELYDPNVSYVSATVSPIPGTNDQWAWTDLAPGQHGSFKVAVQVNKPLPAGVAVITNRARISCAEVTAVDSPQYQTGIIAPVLNIGTADWPDPVNRGNPLKYTIGYTNNGTLAATNVIFTNTLDPYVTFVSATPPPFGNVCPGNVCRWSLPQLNPGGYSSIVINVSVNNEIPCSVARLTNRAAIASAEIGPKTDIEYTTLPPTNCSYKVYLPLLLKSYQ